MEVIKVDKKGRLLIPKSVRRKVGIKEGGFAKIEVNEKSIIIRSMDSIADKYFGAFEIAKWPEDLDEFIVKVIKNWWTQKAI
ncbi:MAG: AbrB/MazE/SpoVT family DNA-binding domain-containing protein [Candidatus Bathyarchaeia archaeon]